MAMKKRKVPPCCTPRRNCKLMLWPGASGCDSVMSFALMLLLKPPPFGWSGGVSTDVPQTVTTEPSLSVTLNGANELLGRRSAMPEGAGKVVMSTTRNLSRVRFEPEMLVTFRRTESVPKVLLFTGSGVVSRTRLGGNADDTAGSSKETEIMLLPSTGLER